MEREKVIHCNECGQPWGIALELREEPDEFKQLAAQGVMVEAWHFQADENYDERTQFDLTKLPLVEPTEIVYITEALASFISEHDLAYEYLEECWQELRNIDIPKWLLRGRKTRWAYRWDCCDLPSANDLVIEFMDA